MIDLSSIVNTVRSAIYGKDMREAIAQGFEKIQDAATGGGGSGSLGGGFVMMDENIPAGQRQENVLYALKVGSIGDETLP